MNNTEILNLVRQGFTTSEIAKLAKCNIANISDIRKQYYMPNTNIIRILNDNLNFKNYFIDIFNNNTNKDCLILIQNHELFKRFKFSKHIISELRYFYELEPKMYENTYTSNSDRIKGYIIRNSKFMSKRRTIKFDLHYSDLEIPEYCPILNIKLTFGSESNGNDFSHASLDRIDNNKGYIKGNVIVISRLANAMKNAATFEQLELFSKNIIKIIDNYKNQGALGSITDIFPNIVLKT